MKKTLFIFAAAALSLAACNKAENSPVINGQNCHETEPIPVKVQFSGAVTKADANDPESKINSLQVALYRVNGDNKEFESYYSFDPAAMEGTIYIDPDKPAEKYLIAAYANQESLTLASISEDWSLFSNEKSGDFQMYGEWFDLKAKLGSTVEIALNRQCSKVTVRNVSLKWTNSANNHKTFKIESMFLMDVEGVFANVHDLTSAVQTANPWLNKNGFATNGQDAFLYKDTGSKILTETSGYQTEQVFYGYVSDLATYNTTSEWAPSGTRLVIEAEFDGKTCYYAVPLWKEGTSVPYRNKHFIFDNIIITKPGADEPYLPLAVETDVKVSLTVNEWDAVEHGNVTIK